MDSQKRQQLASFIRADSHLIPQRRPARLLVVDDNPDLTLVMRELLSSAGYDVVTVSDAASALTEIKNQLPDLILSDVIMPGLSGFDLCRRLKEDTSTRLIPFVLMTGLGDRGDKLRAIESGADDLISKPVSSEELFARVKSLLKLKEFTDELETAESVLCTLGLSVESRDPYTEGHCERLARDAANLGRHLGLEEDSIVALRRGGYLHDLGKIAVPDEILKKGNRSHSSRMGDHETAPGHRREDLLSTSVAAARTSNYSEPSRALRWKWLS